MDPPPMGGFEAWSLLPDRGPLPQTLLSVLAGPNKPVSVGYGLPSMPEAICPQGPHSHPVARPTERRPCPARKTQACPCAAGG